MADITDLVGRLRLVEGTGEGATVEGGVPAPSRTTAALLGWVSEGHVPELAGGPGGAKDKPAAFDEGTPDAGVHVQVQDRPGSHRGPATRFGYGGKAGVVTGQKGSTVSLGAAKAGSRSMSSQPRFAAWARWSSTTVPGTATAATRTR